MTFLEGQIVHRQGLISLWHARIVSGAYKQRRIFHGTQGPELTDDEKLADALMTLDRHVEILHELASALPPETPLWSKIDKALHSALAWRTWPQEREKA